MALLRRRLSLICSVGDDESLVIEPLVRFDLERSGTARAVEFLEKDYDIPFPTRVGQMIASIDKNN